MKIHTVGTNVIAADGFALRVGRLKQEFYHEIDCPDAFLADLRSAPFRVDIFTFLDSFPQGPDRLPYFFEWDNFAVIEISTLDEWMSRLPRGARRALRRSEQAEVSVDWVDFDDALVTQIMDIFNESPIRQGRPFWHYGKPFAHIREMLSRDIERSRFLGAYRHGELIGFVKLILGKNFARTTLIVSKFAHRDKGTNNALVARAVSACVELRLPYLVYGQIDYGKVGNKALAEFKMNNGFRRMDLARYYVPLTSIGILALRCGLHRGLLDVVPAPVIRTWLSARNSWYTWRLNRLDLRPARASHSAARDRDSTSVAEH